MFVLFLLILFMFPRSVNAQIPLFYQLIEAYQPSFWSSPNLQSIQVSSNTTLSSHSTIPTPGSILGVSTSQAPLNIGGDGKLITVALLGDSMIDTLGRDLPALKKSLRQYIPNHVFNLLNYGYGSKDIEHGLFRLSNDYEYLGTKFSSLLSQNPDIIVIESFGYNNYGNTESGVNRHWLALGALTSTIKQKLPHAKIIIAATIAPNSTVFGNGIKDVHFTSLEKIEKSSTIKLYIQNAINFATSQGFPLADAYHLSMNGNEGSREFINSSDNLHPNSFGAELFSDVVADTIFKNKLVD